MTLLIPQKGVWRTETNLGSVGDSSPGANLTTGASETVKGTLVEVIASTSFDAYWITVGATNFTTAATVSGGVIDILIGAATEEVLIPDLLTGQAGQGDTPEAYAKVWGFPLYIPAGSRLSARAAGEQASDPVQVWVMLHGGSVIPPWPVGQKVTTYGTGTTPQGTALTLGTSGAEGNWTEIAASTSREHFFLTHSFQFYNQTVVSNQNISMDIGVGAATEQQIVGPLLCSGSGSERVGQAFTSPFAGFVDVPSGSRLTMRGSTNIATADTGFQVSLHGVS